MRVLLITDYWIPITDYRLLRTVDWKLSTGNCRLNMSGPRLESRGNSICLAWRARYLRSWKRSHWTEDCRVKTADWSWAALDLKVGAIQFAWLEEPGICAHENMAIELKTAPSPMLLAPSSCLLIPRYITNVILRTPKSGDIFVYCITPEGENYQTEIIPAWIFSFFIF